MTINDLKQSLQAQLAKLYTFSGESGYVWIADVDLDEKTVVFEVGSDLYQVGYELDDNGVKISGQPVQVQPVTTYKPVGFARFSAAAAVGEKVAYSGEIFRAGAYLDKNCVATPEDILRLAEQFNQAKVKPLIKIQHTSTPFDKALEGVPLLSVEATDDGRLMGTFEAPLWLREALGPELSVSVGLSLVGSRPSSILELSIVDEGRVPTAKVQAAFAGAKHSKADMAEVQKMHDAAMTLGATCGAKMAGARHSKGDMEDFQAVHDIAVKQGATCMDGDEDMSAGIKKDLPPGGIKKTAMTLTQKLKAMFAKNEQAFVDEGVSLSEIETVEAAAPVAANPELESQISEFAAYREQQDAILLNQQALAFANDQIRAARALPSQRDQIVTMFKTAVKADASNGPVKFSDLGEVEEGNNLKTLREYFGGVKPHTLFATAIPDAAPKEDAPFDEKTKAMIAKAAKGARVSLKENK